jgi:hypothetical protein
MGEIIASQEWLGGTYKDIVVRLVPLLIVLLTHLITDRTTTTTTAVLRLGKKGKLHLVPVIIVINDDDGSM